MLAVFIHDRIILNNLTLFYKGVEITVEEAKEILKKSEGLEKIKAGSLSRGERICKYNRLLRIEEEILKKS